MWHVQSGYENSEGEKGEDEEHPDVKALGVMEGGGGERFNQ
jgi:hypothetical protein